MFKLDIKKNKEFFLFQTFHNLIKDDANNFN